VSKWERSELSRRQLLEAAGVTVGALVAGNVVDPSAGAAGAVPSAVEIPRQVKVGLTRVFPRDRWTGSVGGKPVSVVTNEPNSRSHAKGSFGGDALDVHWTVSPNSSHHCTTKLHGSFGAQAADLVGHFRLSPDFLFEHGHVHGTLGSRKVDVTAKPARATAHDPRPVRTRGTVGSVVIDLLFERSAQRTDHFSPVARLRGTVGGEKVHFEAAFGVDTLSVGGVWSGPTDVLALVVGSLLYFV